jgi:hypothetical protein
MFAAAPTVKAPPPTPSLLSSLAHIWQSGTLGPPPGAKGPVRQLTWEKEQLSVGQPGKGLSTTNRITITYDPDEHEIERIEEIAPFSGSCATDEKWQNARRVEQAHKCTGNRGITNVWWSKWTYDPQGRTIEIHSHNEASEPRYFYNYDANGRMIGWDYRQWGDELFSRAKIRYLGNTVEVDTFDKNGVQITSQVQILDGEGRLLDLKSSELRTGKMTLWFHTSFKYDQRGRVVEQRTDDYSVGVGADNAPLPGRFVARYDDTNHTIEELVYDNAGHLGSDEIAQLDQDGFAISFRHLDEKGNATTGSEFLIDDKTGKPSERKGEISWEVMRDNHGNWTERKAWFVPADGSPKVLVRVLRQKIEYR